MTDIELGGEYWLPAIEAMVTVVAVDEERGAVTVRDPEDVALSTLITELRPAAEGQITHGRIVRREYRPGSKVVFSDGSEQVEFLAQTERILVDPTKVVDVELMRDEKRVVISTFEVEEQPSQPVRGAMTFEIQQIAVMEHDSNNPAAGLLARNTARVSEVRDHETPMWVDWRWSDGIVIIARWAPVE